MNSLTLEQLKLPEFSPANDVPTLIQHYVSQVEPQISRVMTSIATGIQQNYATCVAQKVKTRLGTSAPEDVFTMVHWRALQHSLTGQCCSSFPVVHAWWCVGAWLGSCARWLLCLNGCVQLNEHLSMARQGTVELKRRLLCRVMELLVRACLPVVCGCQPLDGRPVLCG